MATTERSKARASERQAAAIAPMIDQLNGQSLSRWGRWSKRGILAVGVIAAIAVAVPFIIGVRSPTASGPKLTHEITRGELLVTVTEEGTLESSNNAEIKCQIKGGSTILWIIEDGTEVKPGDELVRLDTSTIEDNISQQQIAYESALANKIIAESDVAVAKTSTAQYLKGTYQQERQTIENEIFIAEEELKKTQLSYESIKRLVARGTLSPLQLEGEQFHVDSAKKALALAKTNLTVLDEYTKEKTLQELRSALMAAEARLASDSAALDLEKARLDLAKKQLDNCVIRAKSNGMVTYPTQEPWRNEPAIEEGSTVREQQTLLQIPDLNNMQVKVGIHEAKVDKLQPGMPARIEVQGATLDGEVLSVASVTGRVGWWNGNIVEYDTIIKLNSGEGLKPGMSAEVKIFLARYDDVLTIPVAAVVQDEKGFHCWVNDGENTSRRIIDLGDSNDEFMVVKAGLKEGDRVVLNPRAFIEEAQAEALKPSNSNNQEKQVPSTAQPDGPVASLQAPKAEPVSKPAEAATGNAIAESDQPNSDRVDSNKDGAADASESDVAPSGAKESGSEDPPP